MLDFLGGHYSTSKVLYARCSGYRNAHSHVESQIGFRCEWCRKGWQIKYSI